MICYWKLRVAKGQSAPPQNASSDWNNLSQTTTQQTPILLNTYENSGADQQEEEPSGVEDEGHLLISTFQNDVCLVKAHKYKIL